MGSVLDFFKQLGTKSYNGKNNENGQLSDVEKSYEDGRLEEQLKWHRKKSAINKFRFRLCQLIIMVVSAIIPLVNIIDGLDIGTRVISSLLGAVVLVVTGITQLEKYHENWIIYRTTQELLKKEKYFYKNSVAEYANLSDDLKRKLLVERVEALVSSETNKYFIIHQQQKLQGNETRINGTSIGS